MGTNFFWNDGKEIEDNMDPEFHIGKRSAAGLYCWDCGVSLCEDGNSSVHSERSAWHSECPMCGSNPTEEKEGNPVMVELGFSSPRDSRPRGVRGASSFSWAQEPTFVIWKCEDCPDEPLVIDEYGKELSGKAFLGMLKNNCPIRFTRFIDTWFS